MTGENRKTDDGVGCSCGWPLDLCSPKFSKDGRCDMRERAARSMADATPPPHRALTISAYANGEPVVLAVRWDGGVIALDPKDARRCFEAGQLVGWKPSMEYRP